MQNRAACSQLTDTTGDQARKAWVDDSGLVVAFLSDADLTGDNPDHNVEQYPYDLQADPHERDNRVADPALADVRAELRAASHLWGLDTTQTEDALKARHGKKAHVMQAGIGGENRVRYAALMNMVNRANGRTGMGAVMGAKRLKAVACAGGQSIDLAEPTTFHQKARRQYDLLDESFLKVGFDAFGTNMIADMVNVRGGYPTRNWQMGRFEQIEEINAQAMTDQVLVDGVNCFACPVICGRGTCSGRTATTTRSSRWTRSRRRSSTGTTTTPAIRPTRTRFPGLRRWPSTA